jgi:hypothetical protein
MDARRFLAVITLLAVTTVALGAPLWRAPYNRLESALWSPAVLPGLALLAGGAMYLVVCEVMRARRVALLMAACAPIADIALIIRDTAADPTSHNLWPFELVMMTLWGLMAILPGLLLGAGLRAWARKQARG